MSSAPRKKINARRAAEEILSGMADVDLMEKYGLSSAGLRVLMQRLFDAGLLTREQLSTRSGRNDGDESETVRCPMCGRVESRHESRCGGCGTVLGATPAQPHPRGRRDGADLGPAGIGQADSGTSPDAEEPKRGIRTTDGERRARAVSPVDGLPAAAEPSQTREQMDNVLPDESDEVVLETRSLESEQWIMLAVGPAAALICFAFFWFRWTLETFRTLVHEMGHTIFGWIFGYPSFPAFDFLWGGGVTLHTSRSTALVTVIYCGFAALAVMYRKNPVSAALIVAAAVLHALLSWTKAHSVMMLFMGHGTELIIAGYFIYASLSGRAVVHAAERPLYAIAGSFMLFADIGMAFKLLTSASHRYAYLQAKGGDMEMDFIRISRDFLNVDMTWVVWIFLICCLLSGLLSFLAFRYEEYVHYAVARLWARESPKRASFTDGHYIDRASL